MGDARNEERQAEKGKKDKPDVSCNFLHKFSIKHKPPAQQAERCSRVLSATFQRTLSYPCRHERSKCHADSARLLGLYTC